MSSNTVSSTNTVGLDLGDRFARYSEMDFETDVIAEGRLRARDSLVRARTQLVNHVRGAVKALGARLPSTSTRAFARKVEPYIPETLRPALRPLLEMIETLSQQIRAAERELETLARERYPETDRLRQVAGVGRITALCYILTLEDPAHFKNGRSVGAYLGLRPRQRDSGARSPQLRITKRGDAMLVINGARVRCVRGLDRAARKSDERPPVAQAPARPG